MTKILKLSKIMRKYEKLLVKKCNSEGKTIDRFNYLTSQICQILLWFIDFPFFNMFWPRS